MAFCISFLWAESNDPSNKNLWLFKITTDPIEHSDVADPTEHSDVSAKYPEVVKELLDLHWYFNGTAVPARYPPDGDHSSSPALHADVLGPWE